MSEATTTRVVKSPPPQAWDLRLCRWLMRRIAGYMSRRLSSDIDVSISRTRCHDDFAITWTEPPHAR